MSFPDRDAVIAYILENQLGRRNETEEQKKYTRGKLYAIRKKRAADNLIPGGSRDKSSSDQSDHSTSKTCQQIAKEHNVGEATVRRDEKYANAVDAIADKAGAEVRQKILSGTSRLNQKSVLQLADDVKEMFDR